MIRKAAAGIAGLFVLVAVLGAVAGGSKDSKNTTATAAAKSKPHDVSVSRKFSYCSQLPVTDGDVVEQVTVGTLVHVVVRLHNPSDKAQTVTIMPTREYADGGEAFSPLKDTLEVKVPAHGTRFAWHNYSAGPGHTLVGCRIDVDGHTHTLRVKD